MTDVGVLATLLLAFENGEPPFIGAEFSDGAIVLDAGHGCQFRPGMGDECTGASRVRDSVRYLADLDWLTIDAAAGRTRIASGPHVRKLIEEGTVPLDGRPNRADPQAEATS